MNQCTQRNGNSGIGNGLQRFVDRVADFDTIADCLGVDKGGFYHSIEQESEFFNGTTLDIAVCLWAHDENYNVLYGNRVFREQFGNCAGKPCYECIMAEGDPCSCCQGKMSSGKSDIRKCNLCKRKDVGYDINICHSLMEDKAGKKVFLHTSFHVADAEAALDQFYLRDKEGAASNIFLTVCAGCHKIKGPANNWVSVDESVLHYFDGRLSHGLCSECIEMLYPEFKIM